MINPFRPLGVSLRDLFDDFLLLIVCNLLWALLSLPVWLFAYTLLLSGAPLAAAIVALVGVLPAGPATMGLYNVAFRLTDGRASKLADFIEGARRNVRLGLILTGIAAAGLVIIIFNLGFYLSVGSIVGGLMLGLWLYVLIAWLGVMIYAFPLAFLQETPDLRLLARNAFFMTLGRPLFTFVTLALMVVLFLLSAFLAVPIFLFTIAFLALWSTRATKTLIDDARRRRDEAEAKEAPPPVEEKGRKGQVRPK